MSIENANILIIDDDVDVLLAAKFLLKKHFKKIVTLDSPTNLDHILTTEKIDVALLDMNYSTGATSGKEGFEVLKTIRKKSPLTRIIMMTAYGDIDLAIKAIKEGAFDFMVKPWDNAKFVSTIMSAYKKGFTEKETTIIPSREDGDHNQHEHGFKEVSRIFMFLDIKSSTTIAENLGHLKYFELLNDFFSDIAEDIANNKGQIYQYVGDEVVISWNQETGIQSNNCINCFFDIAQTIERLSENYLSKYGLIPEFKAGLHCGKVSKGTIGTLKKEIIYTGDVLNTTSRIEGLCNQYNVSVLLSEDLLSLLNIADHQTTKIGEINLRGKNAIITLFTIYDSVNSLQKST